MNSSHDPIARLVGFTLLALALTGCRPHDFPQYPPNYREYAYVTNGGSNTVTVVDVVDVRVDREIAVGENPVAVAASPTRNEVYVVNSAQPAGTVQFRSSMRRTIPSRQQSPFIASLSRSISTPRATWPMLPTRARTPFLCWI